MLTVPLVVEVVDVLLCGQPFLVLLPLELVLPPVEPEPPEVVVVPLQVRCLSGGLPAGRCAAETYMPWFQTHAPLAGFRAMLVTPLGGQVSFFPTQAPDLPCWTPAGSVLDVVPEVAGAERVTDGA